MPAPSSSLRIAIVGAGKIGSAFAFQLSRGGRHDVTVIARPGSVRLQQLQRDGAVIDVEGKRADVLVADTLDEEEAYDLVIVTVLAHQMDELLPGLQRSAAKCIQLMFNTFDPERLQEAIGVERCALGMPFVQATLDAEGRLKVTIGAGGQKTIMSQQRWVDVFNAAGLPAILELEMRLWLRCHAPICVAFESVSISGVQRGGGASWAQAMILARGIHASAELIKALGYGIYPKTKQRFYGSPTAIVAAMLWSLSRVRSFRELLATGKVECIELVNDMVTAASRSGTPLVAAVIMAMKPSA